MGGIEHWLKAGEETFVKSTAHISEQVLTRHCTPIPCWVFVGIKHSDPTSPELEGSIGLFHIRNILSRPEKNRHYHSYSSSKHNKDCQRCSSSRSGKVTFLSVLAWGNRTLACHPLQVSQTRNHQIHRDMTADVAPKDHGQLDDVGLEWPLQRRLLFW